MSGFAGIVNLDETPVSPAVLSVLANALAFRSGGQTASAVKGCAGFSYAPLKTTANRPESTLSTLDGVWIVADARLDARASLIRKFDPDERQRLSNISDAELLLHCYRRWGDQCPEHLLGDFSFAVWDPTRRRVFCARDHLGVKPFFYAANTGGLILSNTLECIRAHPGISDALNDLALADFLLFGVIRDPAVTAFSAVQRLPAGHTLVFEPGSLKIQRYWFPQWSESLGYQRSGDYVDHFRELLQMAVEDRITGEHTAVLMSGGLDSTAVAAAARKTPTRLKAFTVVYDRLIPDQERRYSSEAATYLNLPVEYLAADDYQVYKPEGQYVPTPEPSDASFADIFMDHLRSVSRFSSVALSGHGGDSLLAIRPELWLHLIRTGRARQLATGAWQYLRLRRRIPPLGFRGTAQRLITRAPAGDEFSEYPPWIDTGLEARLHLRERWVVQKRQNESPERGNTLMDPLWPALFEGYDPGVTRIPVEVRHPLFDVRVINFCLSLNPVPWCVEKTLFRIAMRGWLPASLCLRPKSPVPGDPLALRLAHSPWVDNWKACPLLDRFVKRASIPPLMGTDTKPYPHIRALALNLWLDGLTNPSIKGTSSSNDLQQSSTEGTVYHP